MEEEKSLIGHRVRIFRVVQAPQQPAIPILDDQRAAKSVLPENFGEHSCVIVLAAGDVHDGLVAEAGGPEGVHIARFVLLLGVFEDKGRLFCPVRAPMYGHFTT